MEPCDRFVPRDGAGRVRGSYPPPPGKLSKFSPDHFGQTGPLTSSVGQDPLTTTGGGSNLFERE